MDGDNICLCASRSGVRAVRPASRLRWGAEAGVKVAGIVLQIGAPKCAVCWTTYVRLEPNLINDVSKRYTLQQRDNTVDEVLTRDRQRDRPACAIGRCTTHRSSQASSDATRSLCTGESAIRHALSRLSGNEPDQSGPALVSRAL
jgi:hypothetical protein